MLHMVTNAPVDAVLLLATTAYAVVAWRLLASVAKRDPAHGAELRDLAEHLVSAQSWRKAPPAD